jgi:hypothetical protein
VFVLDIAGGQAEQLDHGVVRPRLEDQTGGGAVPLRTMHAFAARLNEAGVAISPSQVWRICRPGRPPVYDADDVIPLVETVTETPSEPASRWQQVAQSTVESHRRHHGERL